jgi:oxazoline/thiazoline synthase
MFIKPQFKSHLHVEVVEPTTVYLISEQGYFALSGRIYVLLAPLLHGQHTVNEIVEQLKEQVSIFGIYPALALLESQGYLAESNDTIPNEISAFWSLQDLDPRLAISKLQNTKVSVKTFGAVKSESFISTLASLNIETSDEGDLTVVLVDDYLQLGLEELNSQALQFQKPWMLVKPIGMEIWVGPIFVPGQTGCWKCLAQRLRGNREVETAIAQQKGIATPFATSRSVLPTHFQIGLNLAATEVAKWIVQGKHEQLQGKLIALDLSTLSLHHHVLVKRPQCQVCGSKSALEDHKPKPVLLRSQKKQFTGDGGHRCCSPEQTLQKYSHHISPITGLVSALPKIEVGSDLIHVYSAIHPFRVDIESLVDLRRSLDDKSAGKGKNSQQSRTSGFCEAIERYSGIFTGDEIRIKETYAQLGSAAIHPNVCMQFSANQYEKRQEWNPKHGSFAAVPAPFDEEREVEWSPVWSLTQQNFRYLPTAYCYFSYPLPKDHRFCWGDSNGNAAGNNLEEAILQGFMELVERDSMALWWYNRVKRPAVDLDSFDEPYLQALKNYYQTLGRDLWVLDITSDMNIPSFVAISRRTEGEPEEILLGLGTHFDPRIAILRAVTEMNQSLVIILKTGDIKPDDPDFTYWLKEATVKNQPYLVPDQNTALKVYSDYPQHWSDDLQQDVLTCVEIAAHHGMETLVLDQTRPDIGMSVVKVIVPGMRHFWARFAPGRLYDVPVKLGWLPAPLTEDQLNPIPMFF